MERVGTVTWTPWGEPEEVVDLEGRRLVTSYEPLSGAPVRVETWSSKGAMLIEQAIARDPHGRDLADGELRTATLNGAPAELRRIAPPTLSHH